MLAVPMCNERGEVLGVIQLINCKTDGDAVLDTQEDVDQTVVPFSDYHMRLMEFWHLRQQGQKCFLTGVYPNSIRWFHQCEREGY